MRSRPGDGPTRRSLLSAGVGLLTAASVPGVLSSSVKAKDYVSRREALDDLDQLAALCGMRLGMVRAARPDSARLVSRFLAALENHRATREDVRRKSGLPRGLEPAEQVGEVDADLAGLRQALDDLMVAYAESLPVFGDASVVSRMAIDMVDISKRRTVIDLWAEAEAA